MRRNEATLTCGIRSFASIACTGFALAAVAGTPQSTANSSTARYLDSSDGRDWPGYGRTFGQQHYSPLAQIDQTTVGRLGLVWSFDLGPENSATQPIAVDGVLYFVTGLSLVHAVNAANGQLLWRYDPRPQSTPGFNLRASWGGVRGIAWWNGKIYTGTEDGRLIAIDAKTGRLVWSVQTFDPTSAAHINGAPRIFEGKVIIGFAGFGGMYRGYVTTYDAETGRRIWRFSTVPGNPADGFENKAMAMAAKTWAGEWWQSGGGSVWNAIAYDPDTDTLFIGTGSGSPHNRRVRSEDRGDNLFVSSIVALDGDTGAYKWHYQTTPGDTWDFDATMDIELADLTIEGKVRKVLLQAPKNGFFYVIDRLTGEFVSAAPYAKVSWASRIDLKSGRPVENSGARYPNGSTAEIWPSGWGAHNSVSMAYSPEAGLAYIPVIEAGMIWSDERVDLIRPAPNKEKMTVTGALVAWNPATQRAAWSVPHPTYLNGGVLVTAGNLVFQGTVDGTLKAYAATTGRQIWSFAAQAPLIAQPISYAVNGRQFATLLTGLGMGLSSQASVAYGGQIERYGIDPRSQARRVLTFALDGHATLPPAQAPAPPVADPTFQPDAQHAAAGQSIYNRYCTRCHGMVVIASIHAPDLRRSAIPLVPDAFEKIVRDGALAFNGMPAFNELTDAQLADLQQYIRTQAQELRLRGVAP